MNALEAYQLYTALWQHFTGTYDFIKYGGKLNVNAVIKGYQRHRNKYYLEKLAKHPDPKGLIISNFLVCSDIYIVQMFDEQSQTIWKEWQKRQESLSYEFSQDLKDMVYTDFGVIHGHLRGRVSIETMVILNDLVGFSGYWNKHLDDPIWEESYRIMTKYKPFLVYDKKKMEKILSAALRNK